MNAPQTPTLPAAKAARKPRAPLGLRLEQSSSSGRRQAAAVLEVLAGVRSPAEAAKALALSLPSYYKLEIRALEGLVNGCQPPPRGARPSPEVEVRRVQSECRRLQHELQRYQALARSTQRTVGLVAPPAPAKKMDARGRKRRRPAVRALKAAKMLQSVPDSDATTPVAPTAQPVEAARIG
jgi:hypothetical protein